MNGIEKYEKEMQIQKQLLDNYDFIPYLERHGLIAGLIAEFEFDHDQDELPNEFQGNILNFFNEYDLVNYLSIRYPQYYFPEVMSYTIMKRS